MNEDVMKDVINDRLDETSRKIGGLIGIIKDEEFPHDMRHDSYIAYKATQEYRNHLIDIRSLLPDLSHDILKLRFIPEKISELLAEFRDIAMKGRGVDKAELLKCIQDIDTVYKGHQEWMLNYNNS